jgi:hypothetical protein
MELPRIVRLDGKDGNPAMYGEILFECLRQVICELLCYGLCQTSGDR